MEKNVPQSKQPKDNTNQFICQELDEIVYLSILYDFYGELLNEHKRQIFEDYILNDLSLSEIAKVQGISRQGVYDIVKRCSQELRAYESRMSLVKRFQSTKDKLEKIKKITDEINSMIYIEPAERNKIDSLDKTLITQTVLPQINEIGTLADEILKEL